MTMIRKNVNHLFSETEIAQRVVELGRQIALDYVEKDLVLVVLLDGAFTFAADLARAADLDLDICFIRASSYGSAQISSGEVEIVHGPDVSIQGRHVLIVEDIVDTGLTLTTVKEHLRSRLPASLKVCTMLNKPAGRLVELSAEYVGFTIEDLFVVGYGMDVGGRFRNLPYIGVYAETD